MWSPNRITTEGFDLEYHNTKPGQSYSLQTLKRANDLDKVLREHGCAGLEICGDKIKIKNKHEEHIFRPGNSGPWPCRVATTVFSDKTAVISIMCLAIMLWQEGYIEDLKIGGTDMTAPGGSLGRENGPLWQTAWSIYLSMKEAENASN